MSRYGATLFFHYLTTICKVEINNSAMRNFWLDQLALLNSGISDSRLHDNTLVYSSWYKYDYLKGY